MVRRLAIPAPPTAPSTADLARPRAEGPRPDSLDQARPFDPALLRAGEQAAETLVTTDPPPAVNGDLHSAQLLPATREPRLTVDPVLLRGEPAHDLAKVLWTEYYL
ncbi:hypothetical protein ACIQMJ_11110 [Actinosynnema sp. NPDC091369]